MTTEVILDPGGANEQTIPKDELNSLNPVLEHTGIADAVIELSSPSNYLSAVQRQDRVNIKVDGTVVYTGYLTDANLDKRSGAKRLETVGIAKRLEETRPDYNALGGSLTYQNIALDDAIRDYWGRTPFDNFTVKDQQTEEVVTDETVQSADTNSEWNSVTPTFDDDEPIVVQNGNLELAQVGFYEEAEDATIVSGGTVITDAGNYSDDEAVQFDSQGTLDFEFTTDHRIPDGEYTAAVFADFDSFDGTAELKINGNGITQTSYTGGSGGLAVRLKRTGINEGDLDTGTTHNLRFEITSYTSGQFNLDALWLFDEGGRFSDNYDINGSPTFDSNTASWSGPELYPLEYTFELNSNRTSFNITELTHSSTWNNTDNNQRISLSNDDGGTYQDNDNTDNPTNTFSSVGQNARVKYRLSRFTANSVVTPTNGDTGQTIDSFTLTADGNDRAVIDQLELSRNHFENLQQLHEYGEYIWTIEHGAESIANIPVESYRRGQRTESKPDGFDDPDNQSIEIKGKRYYNSIYLQGAKPDSGSRPVAEVKDQDAINNDGREISPGVLRDEKITTEGGAGYRARNLLEESLDKNNRTGSVTVPLTVVDPGYARPVDLGAGEVEKVVERVDVSLTPTGNQATFELTSPEQLAEEISQLKRNTRDISDQT